MFRNRLFWGAIIVIFGVLLLLENLGLLTVNVWGLIWPVILIILGLRVLLSLTASRQTQVGEQISIPLGDTTQASIQFYHGAGELHVGPATDPTQLLSGTFSGGVEHSIRQDGLGTNLQLRAPTQTFWDMPWFFGDHQGFRWNVGINPEIPLALEFKTGASESDFDLTGTRVTDLRVDTGASSTTIYFPENAGLTRARLSSGAASIRVRIPESVAARIDVKSGLSSINIDTRRFIQSGNTYQSPDYISAANKAEITFESGVGSINVS